MGYMRHHAIIVTGPAEDRHDIYHNDMIRVQEKVAQLCEQHGSVCDVTPVTRKSINSYASFLVAPDGSKEGWDDSKKGDNTRNAVVDYLRTLAYSDGSTAFGWAEVQFHDDEKGTKITRDSDHPEPA